MYIRFSWSVGVAGGRKEVSTHTDTMVQFPFASPQDAARIYTRATHTHTNTKTNTKQKIHTWRFHWFYCCWLLLWKKTPKQSVDSDHVLNQCCNLWHLQLPKDRAGYGKQVVESCFFFFFFTASSHFIMSSICSYLRQLLFSLTVSFKAFPSVIEIYRYIKYNRSLYFTL